MGIDLTHDRRTRKGGRKQMNVRHILGISGGKDNVTLSVDNPSVISQRSIGGSPFFDPSLCILCRNNITTENQNIATISHEQ